MTLVGSGNHGITVANETVDTFKKLGKLNNPGMIQTDKYLLEIIQENQAHI